MALLFLMMLLLGKNVMSQDTSFKINAFTNNSLLLTYERDAFVPPDETFVRLVPAYDFGPDSPVPSVGRVLYTEPIKLWDKGHQASFETTITLQVTPYSNTAAYGMTFFIIPVNSTKATGGELDDLGIYGALDPPSSPFVTVEFDLWRESAYDPDGAHIGININSKSSQSFTIINTSIFVGKVVTARIKYNAPARTISVDATYGSVTSSFRSYYNLRDLLPQQVQVGLSASSATPPPLAGYFDVYTWKFDSTMGPDRNTVVEDDVM